MAKRRPPSNQFKPVVVYDRMGFFRQLQIAAAAEGEDVTLLMSDTTRYDVFTRDVLAGQIGNDARYAVSEKDPSVVALRFKERALTYGATPEAIRLIGLLCPFSKEELNTMAEKKLAPKAGDKEGLKAAAKAAPVGGKKTAAAPKPKGNPEALEKARAATAERTAARDKQKIKVLNKNHGAREGSKRAEMLDIVIKAKTVGEAIENGAGWIDVKFAADKGFISLG